MIQRTRTENKHLQYALYRAGQNRVMSSFIYVNKMCMYVSEKLSSERESVGLLPWSAPVLGLDRVVQHC